MAHEESEIAKLTERIEKDPKSKLFVPLAEEYKKAGDLEMAIHVLTEGLKNNPGYVTAKSFLGRLLADKGDLAGAKKEFEEVVKAIPDNLLAQRKLGDVNALQGNTAAALIHYKVAQSLNPQDEELVSLIRDLEAGRSVAGRLPAPKKPAAQGSAVKQSTAAGGPPAAGKPKAADVQHRQAPRPLPQASVPPEDEPEEILVLEQITPAPAATSSPRSGLTGPQPDFEFPAESSALPDISRTSPQRFEGPSAPEDDRVHEASGQVAGRTAAEHPDADDFSTDTLAELYIAQGFFEKAIDIYERMLAENPGSAALRDKLTSVRAMAGISAPAEGGGHAGGGSESSGEVREWVPEPPIHSAGEGVAEVPPPPDWGAAFEPPVVERDSSPRAYGSEMARQAPPAGPEALRAAAGGKHQQTVVRLEQWLKNIMKEKKS